MITHDFFYSPPELISDAVVEIQGEEFRHLTRVMRKKPGDIINVVDGIGNVYTVVIKKITRTLAQGEIQKRVRLMGEPIFQLTLAQAIPKSTRFDWVVEKSTELGVAEIIPLVCDFSVKEGSPNRRRRWEKIAIAAMKQCHRSRLPKIHEPVRFSDFLAENPAKRPAFMAHPEKGAPGLSTILLNKQEKYRRKRSAIIFIGPEGGFSENEIELAKKKECQFFTLGQRRLRAETAGIAAVTIFMELIEQIF
ncbi:MAG: 16S rRNA (uracil(1498)-N(3))-methyltransferase [Calditrichaeota bacterium]|nr:16S rRNA (uracil(1498)-N(3))-methyltransferase [Calditrichota bacterium]